LQPAPTDDEFDEISDEISRLIIISSIMDISEMILEEQWKRNGGQGSLWEQALVEHRSELQQGLALLKESEITASDEASTTLHVVEIPFIIIQEPEPEDDRAYLANDGERVKTSPALPALIQEISDYEQSRKQVRAGMKTEDQNSFVETPNKTLNKFFLDASHNVDLKVETDMPFPTHRIETNTTIITRGAKRSLDEAGLHEDCVFEQGTSKRADGVCTPQKRQDVEDLVMTDSSPTTSLLKSSSKRKTPRKKAKTTPASVRRKTRSRH
jgi:hypothetical protein